MLVVTHEMGFARGVAPGGLHGRGRVVEQGPPDAFFDHPREERTKRFLDKILA